MNTVNILSILEKYYLHGLIEKSRATIRDKKIKISFVGENKDLVGVIESGDFELDDSDFAVNDTTRLLKLMKVTTDTNIDLKLNQKDGKAGTLLIADKTFNSEFRLADLELVRPAPQINEPNYTIKFKIDQDFITNFTKAKKALDTEIVTIESNMKDSKTLKFNLGGTKGHTHKINFSVPADFEIPGAYITFKINEINEILSVNGDLVEGTGYICEDGLMKFVFINSNLIKSTYLLVAKEE